MRENRIAKHQIKQAITQWRWRIGINLYEVAHAEILAALLHHMRIGFQPVDVVWMGVFQHEARVTPPAGTEISDAGLIVERHAVVSRIVENHAHKRRGRCERSVAGRADKTALLFGRYKARQQGAVDDI